MLRAALFSLALSFSIGCSGGAASCKTTCDCNNSLAAPEKCPGEWGCSAAGTCEYSCKNLCDPNGVSTCRADEECGTTFCTARKACK